MASGNANGYDWKRWRLKTRPRTLMGRPFLCCRLQSQFSRACTFQLAAGAGGCAQSDPILCKAPVGCLADATPLPWRPLGRGVKSLHRLWSVPKTPRAPIAQLQCRRVKSDLGLYLSGENHCCLGTCAWTHALWLVWFEMGRCTHLYAGEMPVQLGACLTAHDVPTLLRRCASVLPL